MAFRPTRGKLMRQVRTEGWEVDWRDAGGGSTLMNYTS